MTEKPKEVWGEVVGFRKEDNGSVSVMRQLEDGHTEIIRNMTLREWEHVVELMGDGSLRSAPQCLEKLTDAVLDQELQQIAYEVSRRTSGVMTASILRKEMRSFLGGDGSGLSDDELMVLADRIGNEMGRRGRGVGKEPLPFPASAMQVRLGDEPRPRQYLVTYELKKKWRRRRLQQTMIGRVRPVKTSADAMGMAKEIAKAAGGRVMVVGWQEVE